MNRTVSSEKQKTSKRLKGRNPQEPATKLAAIPPVTNNGSNKAKQETNNGSNKAKQETGGDSEQEHKVSAKTLENPKIPGIKTILVGNLPFTTNSDEVNTFFSKAGEVANVRIHCNKDGTSKGACHVQFATPQAAQEALKMHGSQMNGRALRVCIAAHEIRANIPHSRTDRGSFQKPGSSFGFNPSLPVEQPKAPATKTVFVMNLSVATKSQQIKKFFAKAGEVTDVQINLNEDGTPNGHCHVGFATAEAAHEALKMTGMNLDGRVVRVFVSKNEIYANTHSRNDFSVGIDPSLSEEQPKACTTKTVYVRNLPFAAESEQIKNFFAKAGKVTDVGIHRNEDGSCNGRCHVGFATAEAAQEALKMNGKRLDGRLVRVFTARHEVNVNTRSRQHRNDFSVLVQCFDPSLSEEQLRSCLEEHFTKCGKVTDVSIIAEAGKAYVSFDDVDSFTRAICLGGSDLGGFKLYVAEE